MINLTITLPDTLSDQQKFWWPNLASWEAYWANAVVTLNPTDLPSATTADKGCVKQANTNIYNSTTLASPSGTNLVDMSGNTTQVISYTLVVDLITAFNNLQTNYVNLKNALISAGIITK